MKKSNKLLLGAFMGGILLLSAIHISLYAKYRSGDHIPFSGEMESLFMQSYPHAKFVSIRNVENIALQFGDSLKTEKAEDKDLQFSQQGDTLHINGSDTASKNGYWNQLRIQLPYGMPVAAFNSQLYFSGKGSTDTAVFPLTLNASKVSFFGEHQTLQLGSLQLTAVNNSGVQFHNSHINTLGVHLNNSYLDDVTGTIDSLAINTDVASHISLQTKHLLKAKINTTVQK